MSDDEDDDDFTFASSKAKGNDLIREDTYQGSAHPDVDGSKAGVNLGLATVDFSDNSCSLTTPSRDAKRHRNPELKEPGQTGSKPSPKAKVPRVEPRVDPLELDSDGGQWTVVGGKKGAVAKASANAKEEIEVSLPPAEPAKKPAAAAAVLRSREVLEAAGKSPQKTEAAAIDWDRRRETRQKQIEKAQDTEGYRRYKKLFPVPGPKDPRTPRCDARTERKAFDFELKVWKTFLHKFDNVPTDLADSI